MLHAPATLVTFVVKVFGIALGLAFPEAMVSQNGQKKPASIWRAEEIHFEV